MREWPDTSESMILRVKDHANAAAWSTFLAIYRPVVWRMACSRGLQHADADDLAQKVFIAVAQAIDGWEPTIGMPPFRVWLTRIARNAIVNALTRRKPDRASGSTSVQDLLNDVPERDGETSKVLLKESRVQALRWAAEKIRSEFSEATWAMFWKTSIEGRPVADVAGEEGRSPGAVYIARCRVMQRLKQKLTEVSDLWSEDI